MLKGTTKSGFSYEIEETTLNDMELFENLCDVDAGDVRAIVPACKRMLGEQKKALYEHLRGEDGRVPMDAVLHELTEILKAGAASKNS